MKPDDLENELRNLKLAHLTESELVSYCDDDLDPVGRAMAEAHIRQCFICERELELLREQNAALKAGQVSAEDLALVERLMEQVWQEQSRLIGESAETAGDIPLNERLAEYLRQMVARWRIDFAHTFRRGEGEKIWQWQSDDERVRAWATMEKNADLVIHFSSSEMNLEGTRIKVRLGGFNEETILQRVSEDEVYAKVAIPWQHRQRNVADISVESM